MKAKRLIVIEGERVVYIWSQPDQASSVDVALPMVRYAEGLDWQSIPEPGTKVYALQDESMLTHKEINLIIDEGYSNCRFEENADGSVTITKLIEKQPDGSEVRTIHPVEIVRKDRKQKVKAAAAVGRAITGQQEPR